MRENGSRSLGQYRARAASQGRLSLENPVSTRWAHALGHRKELPQPTWTGAVPGGHAERRRLLPGAVALPSQALLRLALLEKKTGESHRVPRRGTCMTPLGFQDGLS